MTKLVVSKYVGFCSGVENAIKTARNALSLGKRVLSYGELIHNRPTLDLLEREGLAVANSPDEVNAGDVVVVRAHGLPEQEIEAIRARGATVLDATCVFVKKIHEIVEKAASEGKDVYILGDPGHPEVQGILAHARGKGTVVDEDFCPTVLTSPSVLVAQTTCDVKKLEKIRKNIEKSNYCGANSLEIFDTICYTTKGRQAETAEWAQKCSAVVVVGSPQSANTAHLADVASAFNPNVFKVRNTCDLVPLYNKHFISIFITAGASTPGWSVEEVKQTMSENLESTNTELNASESAIAAEEQPATEAVAEEKAEITMEDIVSGKHVSGYTQYREGSRVKCRVEYAKDEGIYVSIGGKKNGFVDSSEVCSEGVYSPADFADGTEFFAVIIPNSKSTKDEYIALSKKRVDEKIKLDEEAERAIASKEFDVKIDKAEKGGLTGKLGQYIVFIPASQIRSGFVKNLEEYVGKTLRVRALPPKEKEGEEEVEGDRPKRRRKNIVASARVIIEEEKKEKEDAFWNSIHVNDIVVGKVKRFTNFGAFVSVKGFDCLAHISELSWNKITDPSQVLELNESYDFVILKMDRETNKISLGYKQLQKKPYEAAMEKYPIGTIIKGKVERVFSYGAFVFIEPGVDGLIHVSEISHTWIKDATEFFKVGDEVEAKVIGFKDTSITLSIKEMTPAPEREEGEEVEEGERPRRNNSNARFSKRSDSNANSSAPAGERPARRPRQSAANPDEPREWHSNSGANTIGDMLGNLLKDIPVSEDGDGNGDNN